MPNEMNSPSMVDGFHLVVDVLKLNGIDTVYGVAGIRAPRAVTCKISIPRLRSATQRGARTTTIVAESGEARVAQDWESPPSCWENLWNGRVPMSHIVDEIQTNLLRTRPARTLIRRTVGLGFVAGFVNTVGFFDLHVYPGIMSGNTVQLGIAMEQSDWHLFMLTGLTIASFFVGGIAGSVTRRHLRQPSLELIVMAVLLLAATPIRTKANNAVPVELGLLATAMAMQGETISRIGTVSIQTVVVTSNLLHFADALVGRFLSAPAATEGQSSHSRPTVTEVAIPGCARASYSIGACAAALAIVSVRAPLLFPILVVILLVVDMLLNAENKAVVRMAGASPPAGGSVGQ